MQCSGPLNFSLAAGLSARYCRAWAPWRCPHREGTLPSWASLHPVRAEELEQLDVKIMGPLWFVREQLLA